jgi:DNA-binding transcriptional LysR family regulator
MLRVGLIDAAMVGTVNPILRTYHRRYPDVYLSFRNPGRSAGALHELDEGAVDVIFVHPPARVPDTYASILLVNDPLVAVLPEKHRLAELGTLDLSDLANEPWMMFPRENDPPIYDRMIALCQKAGFSPRIVHETGHMLTRLGLVACGFGVHLVHAAWRAMPYPGIVYIPVQPTSTIMLSCYWRHDNDSPLLRNMIDIVSTYAI